MINAPTEDIQRFTSDYDHYNKAVRAATLTDGLFLEFGVASGRSIRTFYDVINTETSITNKTLYGFDWFKGLPEAWDTLCAKGAFACDAPAELLFLNTNNNTIRFENGLFADTLPTFTEQHPEPCWLVHIDCDIYSSTKTIFEWIGPRIVPGTVLVFDEFFQYPTYRDHEFKAFDEFIAETGYDYEYLSVWGPTRNPASVSVLIK